MNLGYGLAIFITGSLSVLSTSPPEKGALILSEVASERELTLVGWAPVRGQGGVVEKRLHLSMRKNPGAKETTSKGLTRHANCTLTRSHAQRTQLSILVFSDSVNVPGTTLKQELALHPLCSVIIITSLQVQWAGQARRVCFLQL